MQSLIFVLVLLYDNMVCSIGVVLMNKENTQKEEIQTVSHLLKDIENRLSLNIADRLNSTIKWQVGISLSLISTVIISLVSVFIYINKVTDDIQIIKASLGSFGQEIKGIKQEIKGIKQEMKGIKKNIAQNGRNPASKTRNDLRDSRRFPASGITVD